MLTCLRACVYVHVACDLDDLGDDECNSCSKGTGCIMIKIQRVWLTASNVTIRYVVCAIDQSVRPHTMSVSLSLCLCLSLARARVRSLSVTCFRFVLTCVTLDGGDRYCRVGAAGTRL